MRSRSSIVSATTSLSSASDFSRKERVGVHELDELAYVLVGNPQDRRDTRRLNLPSRTVGETALVQAAAELEAAERRGNRPNRVLSGGAKAGHDRERWRGNALASPSIPIDKGRTSVRESRAKPAQVTIEAGRPS